MPSVNLPRYLGTWATIAIVINGMIAVGIFLVPAGMAKSVGSPLILLIVWLVMAGMALSGSLCFGELASRYPAAGGGYVYLREAFGAPTAFVYGWMSLMVLDPGITATLATGMASYIGHIFPMEDTQMKVLAILVLVTLTLINILGARIGAWMIVLLTIFKVGILVIISALGFGLGLGDWSNFLPLVERPADSGPLFGALAGGFVGAFFAFAGWWDLNKVAGEIQDPAKVLPKALCVAVGVVTLMYISTSAVFIYLVPISEVSNDETFAAQVGTVIFGRSGSVFLSTAVIISIIGSLTGLLLMAPRVYFAMARDGIFFRFAAGIHPKFGTPYRAIAIQGSLASVLVWFGTFNQILDYFIFVAVMFIGLTVAGLFKIRHKQNYAPDYKTPFYPITPVIFLLLASVLLVLLFGNSPTQALLGMSVTALGIPAYYFIFRKQSQQVSTS